MAWNENNKIKLTISGSLINEDLTNFPLTVTIASGVGTNNIDITEVFDDLTNSGTLGYSDDFTGVNNDLLDQLLWYEYSVPSANTYYKIYENRARINYDSADTGDMYYKSYFTISGDFDIEYDYEIIDGNSTDNWWSGIRVLTTDGSGHWAFMSRGYQVTQHHRFRYSGAENSYEETVTVLTSGTCRITRSGSYLSGYFKAIGDSGWTQVGSAHDWNSSDVELAMWGYKNTTNDNYIVDHDNFIVVSGTVHADHTRKKMAIFSGGDQNTGSKCFTEIEHWDSVNETATLHVQVPTLASGVDTDLYLYYDITQPDQDYRLLSEANDTFTAANGAYPDHTRWREDGGTNYFEIQDNKLYASYSGVNKNLRSRYRIEGDFEIQTDWEVLLGPATNSWRVGFWITQEGSDGYIDYGAIYRSYEGSTHWLASNFKNANAWVGTTTQPTAATSGKFRIRRVGNIMYTDYDIGAGWVNLKSQDFSEAPNIQVIIEANSYGGNPSVIGAWDNFTVSGTVTGFVGDTGEVQAQEVWDSNFVGVWHMAQDPSGGVGAILDSTANTYDGTPSGTMTSNDLIDSPVGKAIDFDGTDDYINLGTFNPSSGDLTIEFLSNFDQKASTLGHSHHVTTKRDSWSASTMMWQIHIQNTNDKLAFTTYTDWTGSQDGEFDNFTHVSGTWQYVAIVHDYYDTILDYLYLNGLNIESHSALAFDSGTTAAVTVGAYSGGGGAADVKIDEFRISSTVRSSEWLVATHKALFDNLIFYDLLIPTPSGEVLPDAEGWTKISGVLTSGIVVRLYRRSTGEFVGQDISSTVSGIWNIPTTFDEYHYAIALYPTSGTNALIYDWLHPTLNP